LRLTAVSGRLGRVALRCLIVDDNEQFLASACRVLEMQGLVVVGIASTSADARRLVTQLRPDLVLVDVHLADEDGLELTRRLVATATAARVIVISTHDEAELAALSVSTGAVGFLPKTRLSAAAIHALLDQDFE
jgi:DNA-binding NarL/FixJ family response regulator